MEPERLDWFRRLLEGLRLQLDARINREREKAFGPRAEGPGPGDAGDASVLDEEEETDLLLVQRLSEELRAVDEARIRLQEGTYGFCDECGDPIPEARLEAVPWATTCARCGSRVQREAPERTL